MKSTHALIACLAVFVLFAARGAGNAQAPAPACAPTLRDNGEWIVLSGMKKGDEFLQLWTYAIRKTSVLSVTIGAEGDASDEGAPEKLKALPAEIRITTSELSDGGGNKRYSVGGLTYAAASAMLAEILEALGAPETPEGEEKKAETNRALRLFPVGEVPPWEEIEIERDDRRGKARLQQEPPAGSVPPHQVSLVNKEGAGEGKPVTLVLNKFSSVLAVTGSTVRLHESNPGGIKPKTWHAMDYPPGAGAALAILWRDPEAKKWDQAKSLTLQDDLAAFPAGMVRIVNVCGVEVELSLDGEKRKLPHGEAFLHPADGGKTHLKVNLEWGGKWKAIANQQIAQDAKERAHVIIYLADGEKPRRPVKALALREVARTPAMPLKRIP